ncbi:hypothetical protein [Paracoccus sp. AS002]|uniref:hypothetical protein n=1 Tax=Paracoccus sp. AS002 TaxID=3019545 RepID=UPI0023E7E207|nr:hypothetical protein [Paracoccus sp. AS002]MDF3904649.1 hypothetical protein [Paracoccus sp. AS002]
MTKPLWMQIREAFERKGYFHPSPELRDELVGIAIDYADQKTAAARDEIERLTKERDEATSTVELVNSNNLTLAAELAGWKQAARQMEAERDEALAQVALAWIAVGAGKGGCGLPCGYDCNGACFAPPTDAQSALEAYGREKVREGMQKAAYLYPQGSGAILAEMEKEGGK